MSKNQKAKYYLRKWPYYDKNVQYLEEVEQLKMKILYEALKGLTIDQREFLAEKYRVFDGLPVNDPTMAKRHRVSLKEYRKNRIQHETIFNKSLIEAEKKYKLAEYFRSTYETGKRFELCKRFTANEFNQMVEEATNEITKNDLNSRLTEDEIRSLVRFSMEYVVREIDLTVADGQL